MIGVTIGIGDKFRFYAERAAMHFREKSGLDCYIITEDHYKEVKSHPVFRCAIDEKEKICFLKFFLHDFFPNEGIVYFDCDWQMLRKYSFHHPDKLLVVRDRTEHLLIGKEVKAADHFNYFNAGFMISGCEMKPLFDRCKEDAHLIPRKYYDQCVWNNLVEKTGVQVQCLHRIFNTMDMGRGLFYTETVGLHNGYNYNQYDGQTVLGYCESEEPIQNFLIRQRELAGLYRIYRGNSYYTIYLHPDGTTSDGMYWIDRGKGVEIYNITGHQRYEFDKLVRLD